MYAKSDYSIRKGFKKLLIKRPSILLYTSGDILKISNNEIKYKNFKSKFGKQTSPDFRYHKSICFHTND